MLELVVASRYGWHRDELYFLEAGKHLAWGYVDLPPFVPLVARAANLVAPGSLVALRVLPALSAAASVYVVALLARELGGRAPAQVATAAVVASSGFLLGNGHLLGTPAFDFTAWLLMLWLVARLLRTGDHRLWVAIGAIAGASLLNKDLLPILVLALLFGVVVGRRTDILLTPWLLVGGAIAVAFAAPNLLWQAHHGWPQLEMASKLRARVGPENRLTLIPAQLILVGPLYVVVLWRGARFLAKEGPSRPLLYAWPAGIAAVLVTGGRPYYPVALTVVVLVAGVVATERSGPLRNLSTLVVPSAILGALVALPVLPLGAARVTAQVNETTAETIGWPELVDEVADVVRRLPPTERADAIVLAGSYGEAGAIDRFGPSRGLPRAYSPHNGYAFFRQPSDDTATVVAVRLDLRDLAPYFDTCDRAGTIDNHHDIDNEAQGQPILVCRGLRGTWTRIWREMTFLS